MSRSRKESAPRVLLLASAVAATALAALAPAGCGLPEKARALVTPKPTATVAVPTPTPIPVPPLQMEFVRIREERSRGPEASPISEIDIQLVGAKRSEIESARVLVQTAVDDLGTNLVFENAAAAPLAPLKAEDPDAPVVLPVPLKLASRKASTLTEVTGEIELYVPGGDPSAAATNPRYLRRYRFALKGVPLP